HGAEQEAVRATGRGKSKASARKVTYGFHLVEGKMPHGMEDRHVAEFRRLDDGNEVGRRGGSTAVTVILLNGETLVVANVGDSRAVVCEGGRARQLSVDHEPLRERDAIERRGGFVTEMHGDVPRVDASLAMSRAFGDRKLKEHISSDPDVAIEHVGDDTEFVDVKRVGPVCGRDMS
uniref:protein-serine/threonine phosphatase n=1 Tax=Aegilops tauschii subsp. strangulata TaxID=200361 RepID=A0A453BE82_AEGTS